MTKIPETELGGINWAEIFRRTEEKPSYSAESIETPKAGTKAVRVAQHPLDRLRARKSINARQWDAGERLRTDYEASQGTSSGGFDGMPRSTTPQSASITEKQIDAKRKLDAALAAVGRDMAMVLEAVVIKELTMDSVAVSLGYSNRDQAMGALKLSLGKLADHYGIR